MKTSLIDIGANLSHKSFRSDLDAVLERARTAGVEWILVTGTNLDASERSIELSREHPGLLRATAGIHPHHAEQANERALRTLERLLAEPDVVAVGECGLDYERNFSPPEAQRRAFEAQLELAARAKKPLFLHERRAHADFVRILRRHRDGLGRAVVHCFTGAEVELDAYLELGLDIGITGWIADERRGVPLRGLVRKIPSSRLMIETDAPFLLPRSMPSPPSNRRNEPAFLAWVLDAVAEAVGRPASELAAETSATAREVFGLDGEKRG